jgi:hypothetical protein
MGFEEDHEAIADIVYRSHSEHDRNRARPESIADMRLGGGSPVVASWRCRYPGPKSPAAPCRVMLDVDQDIVDRLAQFNAQLASRGDDPIPTHEVMVCDAHRKLLADYERDTLPALRMKRQLEMAEAIRQLKESNQPRKEQALLDVLEKRRHPDVEALLATLEEKLGAGRKRRAL